MFKVLNNLSFEKSVFLNLKQFLFYKIVNLYFKDPKMLYGIM